MLDNNTASRSLPVISHIPRLFAGVKIAPVIAEELARIAQELDRPDVRPAAIDDIHLTLVPPWNERSPSQAVGTLWLVTERFNAFTLTIQHVGYGPDRHWPRLLWADCLATEELVRLRAALLDAFGQKDKRPFHPHVTLARIRGNGRAIARKHPIDLPLSLTQRVKSVQLFQSPSPNEQGYRVLASAHLRDNNSGPRLSP
jgi:2'-5' RNA ligase